MNKYYILLMVFLATNTFGQDKSLPYYEIPSYPETFTAGSVASRVIDGLGFRYYWATEGLRETDLTFKPSAEARTCLETLEHIYEMSVMILNSTTKTVNTNDQGKPLPFIEMRKRTLENLKGASDRLRGASDAEMNEFKILFKRGNEIVERPFWNLLNGPIADCLWHVGQVVSFRRSSGNPFSEKVNVFTGTTGR